MPALSVVEGFLTGMVLLILPLSRLPQGGEAFALQIDLRFGKLTNPSTRLAPFPFGKGGGIGPLIPSHTPIPRPKRSKVSTNLLFLSD